MDVDRSISEESEEYKQEASSDDEAVKEGAVIKSSGENFDDDDGHNAKQPAPANIKNPSKFKKNAQASAVSKGGPQNQQVANKQNNHTFNYMDGEKHSDAGDEDLEGPP